jgi:hypothetical protein
VALRDEPPGRPAATRLLEVIPGKGRIHLCDVDLVSVGVAAAGGASEVGPVRDWNCRMPAWRSEYNRAKPGPAARLESANHAAALETAKVNGEHIDPVASSGLFGTGRGGGG